MAVRTELFDPHYDDNSVLRPHFSKIGQLSARFNEIVDGGSCYIPESLKAYEVFVFVFDDHDGDGDEVVGFSAAKSYSEGEEWILTASLLEEGYRGNHLGSDMAEKLILSAWERGAKVITVQTRNERMIHYFLEEGFRITSQQGKSCNMSLTL